MKKRILKRAACVVILTGIVIGAIYGWKYYENEQRKKQPCIFYRQDRLTAYEMCDYGRSLSCEKYSGISVGHG